MQKLGGLLVSILAVGCLAQCMQTSSTTDPPGLTSCDGAWVDLQNDTANCGVCGAVCNSTCYDAKCLAKLATGPSPVTSIAFGGSSVYWTAGSTSGEVLTAPQVGGGVQTIATSLASPNAIAVNGVGVYWTNKGTPPPPSSSAGYTNGSVFAVQIAHPSTMITIASSQNTPTAIALSGANVFWTNQGTVPGNGLPSYSDGTIESTTLDGTNPLTIASNQVAPAAIALDDTYVYWATGVTAWTGESAIVKAPLGGGSVTTILSDAGIGAISSIAVDPTGIYFTNSTSVFQEALTGAAVVTLESNLVYPNSIAVSSGEVYVATQNDTAAVLQIPVAGGAPTILAVGDIPTAMAANASSVFWGTGNGPVMAVEE